MTRNTKSTNDKTAQRDINKIDKTIMDNFYKLVHSQQNVRLTAAASTFKILNAMKKNNLKVFNDNLNYSIERLVSGLASSRALARRGYGTLLLELLNNYQISTERLLSIAQQKFGHISKETSIDNLLGYFLLISVILESGNHKRSKANTLFLEKIYNHLIQLHHTKSYLDYSVSQILVDYLHLFYPHMVASIPQHAFGSDAKLTHLELLIITLCNKKEPIKQLISMESHRIINICLVLLDDRFQRRPLHPIFLEVGHLIITHFPDLFERFYAEIIFPTFFKANHNELAAMGLELITSLVRLTNDTTIIKVLFNQHVVRTLILSLRNRTSLSQHSKKFIESLKAMFESDKENGKQLTVIQRLTNPPGSIAFDEDSKSSSISDLLNKSNPEVLRIYMDNLMSALHKSSDKDERSQVQQACAKQIAFIAGRPQLNEDQTTLIRAAKFLLMNALFKTKDEDPKLNSLCTQHNIPKPQRTFDDKVMAAIKGAYHSSLDHLISASTLTQRVEQFNDLVKFIDQLISMNNLELIQSDAEQPVTELWSDYMHLLKEHKNLLKKQKESKELQPITLLFLFYGLQIVEYGLQCKTQLHELLTSCKREEGWADVLTDQVIAILSATECSPWIRKLSESVFGSLLSHISQTSVNLICDAIKNPPEDEDDIDSEGDDEDDGDDDSYADEASSSDNSDDGLGEQDDVDEEENDGETNDNSDVDMLVDSDENQAQKDSCMKVDTTDNECEDDNEHAGKYGDEEESDEEYLDDDQMMKLDSVIADMFRLNRIGKKKIEPTFQLRCLDLVKRIVTKKHSDQDIMNTILATIIPLAIKSRKTVETRPIADKITRMLNKMPGKTKYPALAEFLQK